MPMRNIRKAIYLSADEIERQIGTSKPTRTRCQTGPNVKTS